MEIWDTIVRWKEPVCITIILGCMIAVAIILAVMVIILGIEVVNGTHVVKNIIGCVFYVVGCVLTIWCFVGMIRA